jgi:hypothetical protein
MFRNTLIGALIAGVLFAACLLFWSKHSSKEVATPSPVVTKRIQYQFEIQNSSNHLAENVNFMTFAPRSSPASESIITLGTSHTYQKSEDSSGNQLLNFSFDYLAPFETRIVTISVELGLGSAHSAKESAPLSDYLGPQPGIEVDNSELINQAKKLKRKDQMETAKAIYEWVRNHLTYSGYNREDKGALYAFKEKKGDCTEYAYLYAALNRINGIPSHIFASSHGVAVASEGIRIQMK